MSKFLFQYKGYVTPTPRSGEPGCSGSTLTLRA